MTTDQESGKYQDSKDTKEGRTEKLSRRDFAKTTVAAAAVGIPGVAGAASQSPDVASSADSASSTPGPVTGAWRKGTTIPAEYYYEPEHYKKDERYIAENLWLLADHISKLQRICLAVVEHRGGDAFLDVLVSAGEHREAVTRAPVPAPWRRFLAHVAHALGKQGRPLGGQGATDPVPQREAGQLPGKLDAGCRQDRWKQVQE